MFTKFYDSFGVIIDEYKTDQDTLNSSSPSTAYMRLWTGSALVQIMAYRLIGAKPLSETILSIGPLGTNLNEILIETHTFSLKKSHLKKSSGKWRPFCLRLNVLTFAAETGTFRATYVSAMVADTMIAPPVAPFTNMV